MVKNQRGITLVALVITIIVLLILAGVSISLVVGNNGVLTQASNAVVENKKATAKEEVAMAWASLETEYWTKWAQNSATTRSSIFTLENMQKYLDGKGTGSIFRYTEGGTSIVIYTSNTDPNVQQTFTIDANGVVSEIDGSSIPEVPYTAYSVGDTVTLGGETFYVIEASDSSTATVKLLAALNVITTEGNANRYKQDASANTLIFDDNSNDYATSEIKPHVDAYKLAIEGRMGAGKTIQEARLMTKEEVEALGGDSANNTSSGCPSFVNATNYWLGSPNESYSNYGWSVYGEDNTFGNNNLDYGRYYGLRPVIVVLKSNI